MLIPKQKRKNEGTKSRREEDRLRGQGGGRCGTADAPDYCLKDTSQFHVPCVLQPFSINAMHSPSAQLTLSYLHDHRRTPLSAPACTFHLAITSRDLSRSATRSSRPGSKETMPTVLGPCFSFLPLPGGESTQWPLCPWKFCSASHRTCQEGTCVQEARPGELAGGESWPASRSSQLGGL